MEHGKKAQNHSTGADKEHGRIKDQCEKDCPFLLIDIEIRDI